MKKPTAILLALALLVACQKPEVPATQSQTTNAEPSEESGNTDPEKPEPKLEDPKPEEGSYSLRVIETTDMHGYIVSTESDVTHYRLAYIAKQSGAIASKPERRLLLDGGDLYQGASISNMLGGWPIYTAIGMMDYDAVALGNHEFDWGWETLVDPDATLLDYNWKGSACQNTVPVVCANIYQYGSRIASTKDYVIVEKEATNGRSAILKVKIGIIGFAVNYAGSIMTSKFTGLGYSIQENYDMAERLAVNLEASGACDATILLVHGSAPAAAASLSRGSAIDLVLGGHSHRYENGISETGVPYLQGGRYAERYATAYMKFFVDATGKHTFLNISGQEIVTVNANADQVTSYLDPQIKEVSDNALDDISAQLKTVIGHIRVDANKYTINGSGGRATTMGNWMCDITRRIGEADVAFVNSGGIRTTVSLNGQPQQNITVAKVYEMFPFDNTVYVYSISYADLFLLLEYSLTRGGSALLSQMTGIDCYYTSRNTVQRLVKDGTTIYQNGSWTGNWASRTLTLALSEYLATTEQTDYTTGKPNPLLEWNNTSRLLYNDLVDNENAVRVLKAEAATSGGLLSIDTRAHYILVN